MNIKPPFHLREASRACTAVQCADPARAFRRGRRIAVCHWWAVGAWAVLSILGWLSSAAAQGPLPPQPETENVHEESAIKAVFLYSFGRYIDWPENAFPNASAPFVIGIVGEDKFAGALEEIAAKKTIQDRRIAIVHFAVADEYKPPCQILFISHSVAADQQIALLKKTQDAAIFVVGETPNFVQNGGNANFFTEGDRIRFEINVDTARKSRLRMDAKLLNLGVPVDPRRAAASK
jgi:hypothetical protein